MFPKQQQNKQTNFYLRSDNNMLLMSRYNIYNNISYRVHALCSNSPIDWQGMWVKDFIHIALAYKCAPNYYALCKLNEPLPYLV